MKARATFVFEFSIDLANYPSGTTLEQALEIEKDNMDFSTLNIVSDCKETWELLSDENSAS